MFNWFWNFLYSISEILFEIVDGFIVICNKLCGIEPIEVDGVQTNFMLSFLKDSRVFMGFAGAALIGIFLLMIFSTIAICKNCADGKKSNGQIAVQVFKTLGLFMLVPTLMVGFSIVLNELVLVLYKATSSGTPSLGDFLFRSFLPPEMDGFVGSVNWTSTASVRTYMSAAGYDLSDYRFFFSWLITIPLLILVARALLMFVERCLSIILLFIMSPISLSTTVLDDGHRFKLWRDKVIAKFISGYGMIIALNIYILVLAFITRSDVVFIKNPPIISEKLANFLLKAAFALGGAFFLPKTFGLVGDLFGQGAGSGEFAAAQQADERLERGAGWLKGKYDQYQAKKKQEEKEKKDREEKLRNAKKGANEGNSGGGGGGIGDVLSNANHNKSLIGQIAEKVKDAILGTGNNNQNSNENNNNNQNNSSNEMENSLQQPSLGEQVVDKVADTTKKIGNDVKDVIKNTVAPGAGGKGS